jgi:hypothetical protein
MNQENIKMGRTLCRLVIGTELLKQPAAFRFCPEDIALKTLILA